jgi:hypothetical protein
MPPIDDEADAIEESYREEPQPGHQTVQLALAVLGTFIPLVALYNAVRQHFTGAEAEKRVKGLFAEVVRLLKSQGKDIERLFGQSQEVNQELNELSARIESPEFLQTVIEAVDRTARTDNKKKIKRFAAILVNGLVTGRGSEQEWEDAEMYIRDISELSEIDMAVLKQLCDKQGPLVLEDHMIDTNNFYTGDRMRDTLVSIASSIKIQMDDIYARCSRLSGYGLVLPLERNKNFLSPSEFGFRITLLGKRLVEILRRAEQTEGAPASRG